jgi:hypothetical protein
MRFSDDVSELPVSSIFKWSFHRDPNILLERWNRLGFPKRRQQTSSTHHVKTQEPINIPMTLNAWRNNCDLVLSKQTLRHNISSNNQQLRTHEGYIWPTDIELYALMIGRSLRAGACYRAWDTRASEPVWENLTERTRNEDRKQKGWEGWQKQKVKLKMERQRERKRGRDIAKTWEGSWTTVHLLLLCVCVSLCVCVCVCVCVPPCNIKADAFSIARDLFWLGATVTLFRLQNLYLHVCNPV